MGVLKNIIGILWRKKNLKKKSSEFAELLSQCAEGVPFIPWNDSAFRNTHELYTNFTGSTTTTNKEKDTTANTTTEEKDIFSLIRTSMFSSKVPSSSRKWSSQNSSRKWSLQKKPTPSDSSHPE